MSNAKAMYFWEDMIYSAVSGLPTSIRYIEYSLTLLWGSGAEADPGFQDMTWRAYNDEQIFWDREQGRDRAFSFNYIFRTLAAVVVAINEKFVLKILAPRLALHNHKQTTNQTTHLIPSLIYSHPYHSTSSRGWYTCVEV